jgi:outer membrane protein assembly factor BamB
VSGARRGLLALALAPVALGGCSWFKSPSRENVEPPAELVEFTPSVQVSQVWSRDLGDGDDEAGLRLKPAYADGRVYGSAVDGAVVALGADDGSEQWRVDAGARLSSGPGVGDGLVVVGGFDGEVIALGADDGAERWRTTVSSEVIAAPAIRDGVAVVRAHDGRVFGLSAADGERRWVFDRSVPLLTLRGNGAPMIDQGVAYVGYDNGKVVALSLADGTLRWEQAVAQPEGRTELERMIDVDGELELRGNELYAVTYRGEVGALAADSGRQLWTRDMSAYGGVALGAENLFLSDDDGDLWALDVRSGTAVWRNEQLANRWLGTPAVLGDYVVVGDFEGYLHWLKTENGEMAARVRLGKDGVRVAPLVVGNMLYAQSAGGKLAAFRVAGG